jgi:hypothetical protein
MYHLTYLRLQKEAAPIAATARPLITRSQGVGAGCDDIILSGRASVGFTAIEKFVNCSGGTSVCSPSFRSGRLLGRAVGHYTTVL